MVVRIRIDRAQALAQVGDLVVDRIRTDRAQILGSIGRFVRG